MKPTPEHIKAKIGAMLASSAKRLAYLCQRWAAESEYEDWAEYAAAMVKCLPEGLTLQRATKRPFGFEFTADEFPAAKYRMTATCAGEVQWQRLW